MSIGFDVIGNPPARKPGTPQSRLRGLAEAAICAGRSGRFRVRVAAALAALTAPLLLPGTPRDYALGFVSGHGVYVPDCVVHWPDDVRNSAVVTHDFRIYNLRNRPLRVQADPSCGCITMSWRATSVPALSWTSFRVSVPFDPGPNRADCDIVIRTDRPVDPYLFFFFVP